jgi:hypothetical protein
MLLKVKEHENLVRDTKSNAILNTDNRGLNAYKNRKMHFSKIDNMEDKIKHLDDRLINIENLLSSLAEKLDK